MRGKLLDSSIVGSSDSETIKRILEGEKDSFGVLVRRHNSTLYKVGRAFGFYHHEVEDLMQETHVSAYVNLSRFENRSMYKTWLTKIMINNCNQRLLKASYRNERSIETFSQHASPLFTSYSKNETEEKLLNRELKSFLENAVDRLPDGYRKVFVLRELDGFSVSETAEILSISEVNVKVRASRSKVILRKQLGVFYDKSIPYEFNLIYCDQVVNKVTAAIHSIESTESIGLSYPRK